MYDCLAAHLQKLFHFNFVALTVSKIMTEGMCGEISSLVNNGSGALSCGSSQIVLGA